MPGRAQPAQLSDVLGALRRHWKVVAAAVLLGLVIGVAVGLIIPARYAATATVAVNPMNTDPLDTSADSSRAINMATEQQLMQSRTVAAAAADLLRARHGLTTQAVTNATSVETPPDSQVLRVTFAGSSPRESADGANAVAKAYLTARHDRASAQVESLTKTVQAKVDMLQGLATKSQRAVRSRARTPVAELVKRARTVQAGALGRKLAELTTLDLNPGVTIGAATPSSVRSTLGILPLGLAGLALGLIIGIPIALTRKSDDSRIGSVDGLTPVDDQLVLDGTQDTDPAETWDIAAFMLRIHDTQDQPFLIMVDSEPEPGRPAPGQELVEALSRRGRTARFVDAGTVNEGKISRGWPTDRTRCSWAGEVVVVDTTNVRSDARKVAIATRSDAVLLARSTTDDAGALRRLAGLFDSKGVDIALTVLFPPRPEYIVLGQ